MIRRATLAMLALAAVAAGCLPQGSRLPESPLLRLFERKSGRIAFVGPDGNVYLTDQTGSDPIAVTDDAILEGPTAVLYRSPHWSPGSDRLALLRHVFEGGALAGSALVIARAEGAEVDEVYSSTSEFPIFASWSPPGDRLALLTGRGRGPGFTLWSVPVPSGEPRVLDTGQPVYWSWSPGGEGLLVHIGGSDAENPGQARVTYLEAGDPVREFGLDLRPSDFQAPAFSPGGDQALMAGFDDRGEPSLLLTDPLGSAPQVLAPLSGRTAFGWAPDGRALAYLTFEPQKGGVVGRLRIEDLTDPASPVDLPTPDHSAVAFFWSPDSRSLLSYSAARPPGDDTTILLTMHVTDREDGNTRRLGTFRPTEEFIEMVAFFDQFQQGGTVWSPDSRSIVFPSITESGQQAIFVIPASGTVEARGIAEGTFAVWSWE